MTVKCVNAYVYRAIICASAATGPCLEQPLEHSHRIHSSTDTPGGRFARSHRVRLEQPNGCQLWSGFEGRERKYRVIPMWGAQVKIHFYTLVVFSGGIPPGWSLPQPVGQDQVVPLKSTMTHRIIIVPPLVFANPQLSLQGLHKKPMGSEINLNCKDIFLTNFMSTFQSSIGNNLKIPIGCQLGKLRQSEGKIP